MEYSKIKNLFMRQSYLDAWDDYVRSLGTANFINWDYCILTASNEDQAEAFRTQIDHRKKERLLSPKTKYVVLSDPDGIRVGSGGATFNVLKYISEEEQGKDPFKNKRILVIHSGGDSKRVPQYSAVGKLFSSFPRQLPDGRGSTLFDEFIIALTGVASRIKEGMLVVSGDVMLLFNPLQIDSQFNGAAAISFKEPVDTGKDHGVFLNDGNGNVKNFLHKQTEQTLKDMGAVNEHGMVDLDTGAILMNTDLVNALFSLISTDGVCDEEKFSRFVNTKARISFYGDFLYPLAEASTLEQFYKEKPEGDYTDELKACRKEIWEAIHEYSLKLLSLAPSRFIHFGTTHELKDLVTDVSQNFEFLDWKKHIISTNDDNEDYSSYNSYVGSRAQIGRNSFIENSFILEESSVGDDCIVSGVKLKNENVPSGVVLHGLPFSDDRYVVRLYGINDNPKAIMEEGARFCGADLGQILSRNNINLTAVWDEGIEHSLWEAKLYTVCNTMKEAVEDALVLFKMTIGKADENEISGFLSKNRTSLAESFRRA
ncbi:MAG: bifunctional fucokinase/L-fucose-1-P-guanylyltransferase, partial [Lachnospiraceae bacterium]|nr:bifunctional fucokinase/L-fucose-1-P-guanylyltransferase [Lachnospiraceae bacterium]